MKFSIVVCEGLRDRVVIASLASAMGWQPVPEKIAQRLQLFVGPPFQRPGNRALLFRPSDDRYLVILERSKDMQADALRLLQEYNVQNPAEKRWDRLLVVLDADALEKNNSTEIETASRQRVKTLFARALLPLSNDPLDTWVKIDVTVPATQPEERFSVDVRAHVLPAVGQPGCLETALLLALGAESHQRLIDALRAAVAIAKTYKPDEYLRHISDVEKATAGAVLSVLYPDQAYTALEIKIATVQWTNVPAIGAALSALRDM